MGMRAYVFNIAKTNLKKCESLARCPRRTPSALAILAIAVLAVAMATVRMATARMAADEVGPIAGTPASQRHAADAPQFYLKPKGSKERASENERLSPVAAAFRGAQ